MRVSVGNSAVELHFGRGMILSSLEAEPLTFDGKYPAREVWERESNPRLIKLEGYMISSAEAAEDRRREMEQRRRALAGITSPAGTFFIKIDGRRANLSDARLVFKRYAPFSGDEAEHFTLTAVIDGGYFFGDRVTKFPEQTVAGFHFPVSGAERFTLGEYGSTCAITVKNGGDVPVGFTAELSPESAVTFFTLTDTSTGKFIRLRRSFTSGDVIRISTVKDSLHLRLTRGGKDYNLSGYADGESELFLLPVGETLITVGDGAPFSGTLSYTEAYTTF